MFKLLAAVNIFMVISNAYMWSNGYPNAPYWLLLHFVSTIACLIVITDQKDEV